MAYYNPYSQMLSTADVAPIASAAAGFAAGGPVGAAIGFVSGMVNRRKAYKELNEAIKSTPMPDGVGEDVYGRPTFDSSQFIDATNNMRHLTSEARKSRRGLNKIFRRGAGGLAGAIYSKDAAMAGHHMDMKANELGQAIRSQRNRYNQRMEDYNNLQTATQQYNNLMNNQSRLANIYNIGTSLY